jgi:hypothetical protein
MPIYFHLASHLWVAWLFIANGLIITWLLRYKYESFRTLSESVESQILSAFFISIGFNGLILLLLDWLSLDFSLAIWLLGLIYLALVCAIVLLFEKMRSSGVYRSEYSVARLVLYALVFIVLFYNGGMIEVVSDAWWHISLANKISIENTYTPSAGHLIGLPTRYYPPLWHGNLALVSKLSDISIPIYWNSLTAWVGMFKVMAFYLLAFGLSKDKSLALVAALLFVLLPGLGVSNMRVSAWPSHIAYTAWFVLFYVFSLMLDDLPDKKKGIGQSAVTFLMLVRGKLTVLFILSLLILFIHKAEILWFAIAWFGYLVAASLSRFFSTSNEYIAVRDHYFLIYSYRSILLALFIYSIWFAKKQVYPNGLISDQLLAYVLPASLTLILLILDIWTRSKAFAYGIFALFVILLFGAINYTHFHSLFVPELALPTGRFNESSAIAIGYLGGELKAPGWHLQLRSGLVFSGVLSIPVAMFCLMLKPTKLTIFLAGTSCTASLLCLSPYLYHWLQDVLDYHSPWRVALIIFHPIIWALVLVSLQQLRRNLKSTAIL